MSQQSLDSNKVVDEAVEALMALSGDTGSRSGGNSSDSSTTAVTFAPPRKSFNCDVCHRGFPTFQALGGHKGHNQLCKKLSKEKIKDPAEKKTHDCSICGKSFNKGQALGGHKARHNDKRLLKKKELPKKKKVHKCLICDQLFLKGQSMGGHMRYHYRDAKRRKISGISTSVMAVTSWVGTGGSTSRPCEIISGILSSVMAATTADGTGASTSGPCFDLNKYPPLSAKEEEDNMYELQEYAEKELEEPYL